MDQRKMTSAELKEHFEEDNIIIYINTFLRYINYLKLRPEDRHLKKRRKNRFRACDCLAQGK